MFRKSTEKTKSAVSGSSKVEIPLLHYNNIPLDLEDRLSDMTGVIFLRAGTLRETHRINWLKYLDGEFLDQDEVDFINALEHAATPEDRSVLLEYYKDISISTIKKAIDKALSIEDAHMLLAITFDILMESETRVDWFKELVPEPWHVFSHLLQSSDEFTRNIASRIITVLILKGKNLPETDDIKFFLHWLKKQLRCDNTYLASVAMCLKMIMRIASYRRAFVEMKGVFRMICMLSGNVSQQMQYVFAFCIWMVTFDPKMATDLNRVKTICILMKILKECSAEVIKIPRIILAIFRNLLEKPVEEHVKRQNAQLMIQFKIYHLIEILESKTQKNQDPEYLEDLEEVQKFLSKYQKELSCFDEYYTEVTSGHLEWTFNHKSSLFWEENAERLNENKYELLKKLIQLLEVEDQVPEVLCVAAYDLAEYMKQFPRGKRIIENLGGKDAMIKLLDHKHPSVLFHVVKSLQILMVNNYNLFTKYEKA